MATIIVRPNPGGGASWEVDTGNGRRPATFGNSMEINADLHGAGFVLEAEINGQWGAVGEVLVQTFVDNKRVRAIKAELILGEGLRWFVDGQHVTKTCTGCPDLPAEFDIAGDSSTLEDGQGNPATEAKGDKTD